MFLAQNCFRIDSYADKLYNWIVDAHFIALSLRNEFGNVNDDDDDVDDNDEHIPRVFHSFLITSNMSTVFHCSATVNCSILTWWVHGTT